MKKVIALILSVVLCLGLFAGCSGEAETKTTEPKATTPAGTEGTAPEGTTPAATGEQTATYEGEFVIGMSGPLTGDAAIYGTAVKNAAEMAIDEINAAGGLYGYTFKLFATDDQHDPTKVAVNYGSMLDEGVHVTLGTVTTKPGLEFKYLSQEDNIFFLTPSASGDDIPEYENGFQMCFADGDQGQVAADYVNSLGLTKIGVFFKADDPYSDGIYNNFKAALNSDIEVVETKFTNANSTDFSAQITLLKECSFVFMPIYYQPAAIFMKQAKEIMPANAVYYGCDGFDGLASEMDLATIPQEVSMLSHFDASSTEGKPGEFVAKYTEKYGAETLNQFGASAYDCVYALYGAMKELLDEGKEVSPDMSASEICDLLKAKFTGGYTFAEGATGTNVTWSEEGKVQKTATKFVLKEAD